MKIYKWTIFCVTLFLGYPLFSQAINWNNSLPSTQHQLSLGLSWDYGLGYNLGYGYRLDSQLPVWWQVGISAPFGENLTDDLKMKFGAEIDALRWGNYHFSLRASGIYRRYENPLLTLNNFGVEAMLAVGYYGEKGFFGGELGFDKAIVTHFQHTQQFKDTIYEAVQDGWYDPTTGGHFQYGLRLGYSLARMDLSLRIGRVLTESFRTTPTVPYYLHLGGLYHLR